MKITKLLVVVVALLSFANIGSAHTSFARAGASEGEGSNKVTMTAQNYRATVAMETRLDKLMTGSLVFKESAMDGVMACIAAADANSIEFFIWCMNNNGTSCLSRSVEIFEFDKEQCILLYPN